MKAKLLPPIFTALIFILMLLASILIPPEQVKLAIEKTGVFGPFVMIFLIWLTNVFAPLGASPFLFAGFYLYGNEIVLLSFVSAVIASITNFSIAKKYGKPMVRRLGGEEVVNKIDELSGRYGYKTLFFIRLILYQQHDVISYASGLTTFRFLPYFLISIVATVPGTLLLYFLSGRLSNPFIFTFVLFIMAYSALIIYFIARKIKGKLYNNKQK